MKYEVEVKRIRISTTQGEAEVWVNGKRVARYGDKIELVDGKWTSTTPDGVFISAFFKGSI